MKNDDKYIEQLNRQIKCIEQIMKNQKTMARDSLIGVSVGLIMTLAALSFVLCMHFGIL